MNRKAKKLIAGLFCFVLPLYMAAPALAQNIEEDSIPQEVISQLDSITSNLSDAVQLESEDIKALAEYQIATFIQSEPNAKGRTIEPGDESTWISLHDLEGNRFAELVPLVDKGAEEIGYITVGTIKDGFSHYTMEWDVSLLKAYRCALSENRHAKAVLFPPMDYGIQTGSGTNRAILKFDMGTQLFENVTEVVAQNSEIFSLEYQIIRNEENAASTERSLTRSKKLLQKAESSQVSNQKPTQDGQALLATAANEDVRLQCEWKDSQSFVPMSDIDDDGNSIIWYGGDQKWYGDEKAVNGCGPVAAANIMYYMSASASKYKNLYPYSFLSKGLFTTFMGTMYDEIKPGIIGEASHASFANKVVEWGKKRGVTLTTHRGIFATGAKNITKDEISKGLKLDKPVALLNLNKWFMYPTTDGDIPLGWHWVTATKYFQTSNDNQWLAISSWGRRISVNWKVYYESVTEPLPNLGGGYVWFE